MGKKENRALFSVDSICVMQEILHLDEDSDETILEFYKDGWYYYIDKFLEDMNRGIRIRRTNFTPQNFKQMDKRTRQCQSAWIFREGEHIDYSIGWKEIKFYHDGWRVQNYRERKY